MEDTKWCKVMREKNRKLTFYVESTGTNTFAMQVYDENTCKWFNYFRRYSLTFGHMGALQAFLELYDSMTDMMIDKQREYSV